MPSGSDAIPLDSLEDVAYLSRSANRVVILEALTAGPDTRGELAESTDVSRTTLDRIVNELEDRGWAERATDGGYVATPAGARLIQQFEPFLESVAAIRTLGGAVEWLPDDELGIGLQHFSDAQVRHPERDDPVETVEYMTELTRAASEFRTLTHLVPPAALLEALRDGVVSGRLTLEGVTPREYSDLSTDRPNRRQWWHEMLEAGADFYVCEGQIPCNLWVIGETVLVKQSHPEPLDESYGSPIVSTNDTVRSWAHDLIDRYRDGAVRIDADAVAESSVQPGDS
jgi:predicted transcriptional regulator